MSAALTLTCMLRALQRACYKHVSYVSWRDVTWRDGSSGIWGYDGTVSISLFVGLILKTGDLAVRLSCSSVLCFVFISFVILVNVLHTLLASSLFWRVYTVHYSYHLISFHSKTVLLTNDKVQDKFFVYFYCCDLLEMLFRFRATRCTRKRSQL